MIRRVVFLSLMLASFQSFAAYSVVGQKIKNISTGWGGEAIYVVTEGSLPAGASCGGGNRFIIAPSAPMYKEMLSMALTALQNKNTLEFYVDGCNGNSMQIKALSISE
ncbi:MULTISPECIES: hypothetical protein [Xanthomonas]|uniref:hypothetical protein n=1 Tax=Xanthomonas TaxID=338 RepID=UPI00141BCF8C|nr:hypothetical protein [Xanthomonas cannabis]NIK20754.1 hypothetical protein [Xanthomonas cannabis]